MTNETPDQPTMKNIDEIFGKGKQHFSHGAYSDSRCFTREQIEQIVLEASVTGLNKWPCDHILKNESVIGYMLTADISILELEPKRFWKFCPICGARKP